MQRKNHRFAILKNRMREFDMNNKYMAELLGIGRKSLERRLSGESAWLLDEMYTTCKELNWPVTRMHELFPPSKPIEITLEPPPTEKIALAFEIAAREIREAAI